MDHIVDDKKTSKETIIDILWRDCSMDKKAFQNIQKKLGLTLSEVSEALAVELFTVQQWSCGTWPVPRPMAKFLHALLSMKRDNEAIYMSGYGRGYRTGLSKGYNVALGD